MILSPADIPLFSILTPLCQAPDPVVVIATTGVDPLFDPEIANCDPLYV